MQINRMFEIIYILLDKKTITAKELSKRLEVSQRTIYRDIEALSIIGIPIYTKKGKNGGISILDNFILNKTILTDKEKFDILSSLKTIDAIHFSETSSVLNKLASLFGEYNFDWIEVDFSPWYNSQKEADIFNKIKSAILSRKTISFEYTNSKGENIKRNVNPIKLCFKGISKYLYAYCNLREDFRFFKLTRIKNCIITDNYFKIEAIEPIFKTDNIFTEEYITLKLKISSSMAFRVYDEFDDYVKQSDGSFIAWTKYPLCKYLFPYIFSFGSNCEVLEPLEVRDSILREIKKIMNNYL